MRIASQAPLQSLRLGMVPVFPGELAPGALQAEFSQTWTNVWINDRPNVLLDYEALHTRLTVGWRPAESTLLEIGIEERSAFGGVLDPLIQNFHHRIGNTLNGRDTVPRGTVNIEIRDAASGELLMERRDLGPFARGVSVTVARTTDTPHGRLAWGATLRVPLRHAGDELTSSTDAGVSAAWSRNVLGRSVHAGAGITRFGSDRIGGVRVHRLQGTGFAAIVQPLSPRTSAVAQYLFNEGVARGGALGRNAHEVSLGGRVRIGRNTTLEVALLENVINFDNGPDFGIHIGVVRGGM